MVAAHEAAYQAMKIDRKAHIDNPSNLHADLLKQSDKKEKEAYSARAQAEMHLKIVNLHAAKLATHRAAVWKVEQEVAKWNAAAAQGAEGKATAAQIAAEAAMEERDAAAAEVRNAKKLLDDAKKTAAQESKVALHGEAPKAAPSIHELLGAAEKAEDDWIAADTKLNALFNEAEADPTGAINAELDEVMQQAQSEKDHLHTVWRAALKELKQAQEKYAAENPEDPNEQQTPYNGDPPYDDDDEETDTSWQQHDFATQVAKLNQMNGWDASKLMPATFRIPPPEPTTEITKAVSAYVSDFAEGFNRELRNLRDAPLEDLSRRELEVVRGLDEALKEAKGAPEKITVMRGLGSADSLKGLKLGSVYVDHGYMSTSLSESQANSFSRDALLVITLPKNFKALPVPSYFKHPKVDDGKAHDNCQEAELILPRGTQLKVTKIEGGGLKAGQTQWDTPRYNKTYYHMTAVASSIQPKKPRAKRKGKT